MACGYCFSRTWISAFLTLVVVGVYLLSLSVARKLNLTSPMTSFLVSLTQIMPYSNIDPTISQLLVVTRDGES